MKKCFLVFVILLICHLQIISQVTKVNGTITESQSGSPIPFVTVSFKGTTVGNTSDEYGAYIIESKKSADSLIIYASGFKKKTIAVKRNRSQRINIELETDSITLTEVVVKAGRNPAFRIMDSVITNKGKNEPSSNTSYTCEKYEKFQIYFGNYSEKLKKSKQLKGFDFIFNYADSLDGKPLLPVYMSESAFKRFVSDSANVNSEILIAHKSTGDNYENLITIADKLIEDVNVYDNYFRMLDKNFVSPITDGYQLFYRYYLEDSVNIDGDKCFRIRYVPKWEEDFTFSGELYIHAGTWAIKKIDMKVTKEINLNYVKDISIHQEFVRINNKWYEKKARTRATISPLKWKKSEDFTVNRSTSFRNYRSGNDSLIRKEFQDMEANKFYGEEVNLEAFWKLMRHDSLDKKERFNYMIADTLNYVPVISKAKKVTTIVASGYMELGKVSMHQMHTFYSKNPYEGDRFKFGLITNRHFNKKIQIGGYAAYGLQDKEIKYKGTLLNVINKSEDRLILGLSYSYDVDQLGVSPGHIAVDNFITSFSQINKKVKLTFNREAKIYIEKEWVKGIVSKVTLLNTELRPIGSIRFQKLVNETGNVIHHVHDITTSEIQLSSRFSINEKFYINEFRRISLGSPYPVFTIDLAIGGKRILGSDYNYQRHTANIKGKLPLNPVGTLHYRLEGGKIFGTVPYPLLVLHPANQTLAYDLEGFNLMNYFEFASDQYTSLYLDHHLDGFILNKIPLLKKAQLREVVSARGVIGSLSDKNKKEMILPDGMKDVTKPYVECSVGLENIFKLLRIEYVRRLTHISTAPEDNWSIKARMFISF
ncbi:MAG: DUF5686 and carboxypeptidase regulatory-like domain-containing protein [Bacteroidota bacterium]|nr:DUF5686 and carboxypeptidase regulatory-like domain-containing protein [Bacteroidota bacterium]